MGAKKKILVFKNGDEKTVLREEGKYWVVRGAKFRKSNPDILEVRTEKKEEPKDEKEVKGE